MYQPAKKRTILISILDLFYVKIKILNERNCSKKRYLIKLWYKIGAAGCKQAVNDDERCQSFAVVFFSNNCTNYSVISMP